MTLSSPILIIEKNHIKVAQFSLKCEDIEVMFHVETKFGSSHQEYKSMNVENIMIKPGKQYSIQMCHLVSSLGPYECKVEMIPISIDYFNLEDRFYLYKII